MGSSDGYSSIEGVIRQSTDNVIKKYELTLLLDKSIVYGESVIERGGRVYIRTHNDDIPIYAFKMNKELERILKDGQDIWNG
jgi:hypothetical protein